MGRLLPCLEACPLKRWTHKVALLWLPAAWIFFFLKQRECSFGCEAERREEEKEVMGRWGQGEASVSPSLN